MELAELVRPAHTAVLTMEVQRGVVGDLATFPALAELVATHGVVGRIAALVRGGRQAGARVAHATAEFRPDRAGSPANCPLLAMAARNPHGLAAGSDSAALVPELGPEPTDLTSSRLHGVSPFTGTSLDPLLRHLGVTTLVACGVSLNVGVLGLCIEAVGLGYQVVVPVDATIGVPREYGQAVLDNTVALLATLTDVDAVLAAWQQ